LNQPLKLEVGDEVLVGADRPTCTTSRIDAINPVELLQSCLETARQWLGTARTTQPKCKATAKYKDLTRLAEGNAKTNRVPKKLGSDNALGISRCKVVNIPLHYRGIDVVNDQCCRHLNFFKPFSRVF